MRQVAIAISINIPAAVAMAGGVILAKAGIEDWQWCLLFGLLAIRLPAGEGES